MTRLTDLMPGKRFTAIMTDIAPGRVSMMFASGDVLTAKSHIRPNAKIGDACAFVVTKNANGQILLEMIDDDTLRKQIDIRV